MKKSLLLVSLLAVALTACNKPAETPAAPAVVEAPAAASAPAVTEAAASAPAATEAAASAPAAAEAPAAASK
jgi:hypothetical protein